MDLWDGVELWVTAGTSTAHEELHGFLDDKTLLQVGNMDLDDDWGRVGSSRFYGASGGSGGEGDSCRKPRSQRRSPTAWPTLVIEAGYSQSTRKLRHKARWWLETSNFGVKIVLLAKLL